MCILKCILKHRILRKIRATFLSLSEEKKATSAGLKRLRRSRRPLAYSLHSIRCCVILVSALECILYVRRRGFVLPIHIKNQALFSAKDNEKVKMSSAADDKK